jgi:hypothetical protein
MVTTVRTAGPARPGDTFDTLNPATSEVIATFPVFGEDDVAEAVDLARGLVGGAALEGPPDPAAGLEVAHHPLHRAPG